MLGKNLKSLRKRAGKSQEEIAMEIGLTRSSYSGYENEIAEPNLETILKISDYFKIALDLLLKKDVSQWSDGEWKTSTENFAADIKGTNLRILATVVDTENNEVIELIPEKARAGYSMGYSDPEYLKVLPTFSLPFLSKEKKYRSFPISGDSMPPVMHGSYVVAEFIQNWSTIKDGQACIVVTKEDGIVFKQVYKNLEKDNSFQLCSTNPLYLPYFVSAGEILEIWKFVNYIASELPEVKIPENEVEKTLKNLQQEVSQLRKMVQNKLS